MFVLTLTAGLLLVILGHQPAAGASAFVAPFLVIFERLGSRSGGADRSQGQRPESDQR
ncbi:hypothetical protein [Streptacidiphilus anmyonensis]|uniref:hypothetical protein n=1 Tax=Streptacidiphilus anmyonensis TaxID=405782 RepID=UPI000A4895D3|nr:hypothetical protein [Streptacidiphilus anmyonensis]